MRIVNMEFVAYGLRNLCTFNKVFKVIIFALVVQEKISFEFLYFYLLITVFFYQKIWLLLIQNNYVLKY